MIFTDVPADPIARREWVKYRLRLKGTSLSQVSRELGVSPQGLSSVFLRPFARGERALAEKLGLSLHQLWPERYDSKDTPLRRQFGIRRTHQPKNTRSFNQNPAQTGNG